MKGDSPLHPNNCFWRQTDEEGHPHSDSWLVISDKQGMLRVESCCSDEYQTLYSASMFTYAAYIQTEMDQHFRYKKYSGQVVIGGYHILHSNG